MGMPNKRRVAKSSVSRKKKPGVSRGPTKQNLTVTLSQFLVDGSDLKFRELVADLFAAVAGMHALRRALAASVGLSAAEYSVILATWHLQKKGAVGIITIARQLHVAAANITSEVGRLCRKGLLHKRPDPADTRAVIVELTDSGKNILGQLTPLLREINDRLFSGNKASDVAVLSRFLRHLADETPYAIREAKTFSLKSAQRARKAK